MKIQHYIDVTKQMQQPSPRLQRKINLVHQITRFFSLTQSIQFFLKTPKMYNFQSLNSFSRLDDHGLYAHTFDIK